MRPDDFPFERAEAAPARWACPQSAPSEVALVGQPVLESEERYFRIEARLMVALELREPQGSSSPYRPMMGRQMVGHARQVLSRLSTRRDADVREALSTVLNVVEVLEREVDMLHRRLITTAQGLTLQKCSMRIGGDGVTLLRPYPRDIKEQELSLHQELWMHLLLPTRYGDRLMVMPGTIRAMEPELTVHFGDLDPSIRDQVIAFVFDHQRKERRRELDADAARQDGSGS